MLPKLNIMHNDIVPPNRKRNPYTSNGKPVMSRDLLQRVGADFDVQTTRGIRPGMTNANALSLGQRQAIYRRRQLVRRYSDSVIGRAHNPRPLPSPEGQGNPTSKTGEVSDTLGNRRPGMAAAKSYAPAPPPPPRSIDGFWRRSR